ncbi:MAG TPA: sigma-70 family RNA polymerase sigma factor [Candidatus Angelobacter sp.]|jgi:RNA polymerase sigma-70 factor (ECF subfamily)|nr:sigma-70 family RNA polymerase sigma factor [Candidatus Angelobacter sp.]
MYEISNSIDADRKGETPATMVSDEALMLEFQQGSREAFEELFARYRGPLYGFFRRRLENHPRAEDLAQETFLAVIRATARYEPRSLVRTYLYGIALKLLTAERRKQPKDELPVESATEPVVIDATDSTLWVRQALKKLEASEREILMLREYEQLSYAEIAELLRLPVNTVRSRLFRSRMALKDLLEPAEKRRNAMAALGITEINEARPTDEE